VNTREEVNDLRMKNLSWVYGFTLKSYEPRIMRMAPIRRNVLSLHLFDPCNPWSTQSQSSEIPNPRLQANSQVSTFKSYQPRITRMAPIVGRRNVLSFWPPIRSEGTPSCSLRYLLEEIASLRPGEADDLLFAPGGERALCRRQKRFLDVFPGAGNKIAAATQVELALDIFAVALNCFYTERE
jgi:hypothetical protein